MLPHYQESPLDHDMPVNLPISSHMSLLKEPKISERKDVGHPKYSHI